ncbi:ephrin type-B receptor 1-like, partial [Paramuricea clavata]
PSGPPRRIILEPINSKRITIFWSPPKRPNGIITSYQLCYSTERLLSNCNSSGSVSYRESEKESVRLEKLLPATVYYFRIRAKTIAGAGPYTKEYRMITSSNKAYSKDTSCGTQWYIVVVSLVSGIIIGILLSYIVSCSRRRRTKRTQSNPGLVENAAYQELDILQE